jgi:prevent-host-death family protein
VAKQFSIAEAKSKLPAIIHSVEDGPYVQLTRHGKPVAVLLSIREYEQLVLKKKGFWSALMEFRNAMEKEGIQITETEFSELQDPSFSRKSELDG